MLTQIESPAFGSVAMLEVGATNVGGVKQTFVEGRDVAKGDRKGSSNLGAPA